MALSWKRTITIVTEQGKELTIDVHTDGAIIHLSNGDKAEIEKDEVRTFADLLVIEQ